jgi:hypothetical protein
MADDPTIQTCRDDETRELQLLEQLRRLSVQDDFAGALDPLGRYPQISRETSEFEDEMRDWGFMYGLAWGLAVSQWPDLPHEEAARLAFGAARMGYVRWAGDIEDPAAEREAAIRAVLTGYEEARDWPFRDADGRPTMTRTLLAALDALGESARG